MFIDVKWFIILFVLALLSCSLFTNEKEEPKPEIPGKLVFSALDGTEKQNYQIYTSLTNGTKRKQLTNFENNSAVEPSWSPDGEQIVFISNLNGSSHEFPIYIMNADGSNLRPLHQPTGTQRFTAGNNPKWSPDGTKIAFEQCVNCAAGGNFDIFVYDFQKDSVVQIIDHSADDVFPFWGSSSNELVFSSNREYINEEERRFREDIYYLNLETDSLKRMTETGNARIPKLHPQNEFIAYEWNSEGNDAFILDIDSLNILSIETNLEFSGSPQWSLNGKHLLLFGRKSKIASPEIQIFSFVNGSLKFKTTSEEMNFLKTSSGINWYYNENEF